MRRLSMDADQVVVVDQRHRVMLPKALCHHSQYWVEEAEDGTLILTPVPGTEFPDAATEPLITVKRVKGPSTPG